MSGQEGKIVATDRRRIHELYFANEQSIYVVCKQAVKCQHEDDSKVCLVKQQKLDQKCSKVYIQDAIN